MDESNERILALSWNLATNPKLYRESILNPYAPLTLDILRKHFPDSDTEDIVRAVVLAEPEGVYDWNLCQIPVGAQEWEVEKQHLIYTQAKERLVQHAVQYAYEFSHLPKDLVYSCMTLFVFETNDTNQIERIYSQVQRRDLRVCIVDYIEHTNAARIDSGGIFPDVSLRERHAPKWKTFKALSIGIFLSLLIYSPQISTRRSADQIESGHEVLGVQLSLNEGMPVRLRIPVLDVNADIQKMGVNADGEMEVPDSTVDVGWFRFGPRPGEKGSAVIAGHFDGEYDESGVFMRLYMLKKGDAVYVDDNMGKSVLFIVRETRLYDPGYAEDVFRGNIDAGLNLITCDGVWDGTKKSFSKRLVVFTDIAPTE